MKESKKIDAKLILLIIIFLILTAINIKILLDKIIAPISSNNKIKEQYENIIKERDSRLDEIRKFKTEEEAYEQELSDLKQMGEKQRMTLYFSKYITYLEEKNYEKAYNLLYEEFRQNYFPTLDAFKEYAQKKYPEFMSIEHTYMSRQGNYYILTVNIYDLITGELIEEQQRYVLKENDFYDYVLSFEVR